MESIVLVIHLVLALGLIGAVLMQRSEGGGLGMGGGGNGLATARGAATAMNKITWGLAAAFIVTSLALTIIAAQKSDAESALDTAPAAEATEESAPATTLPGLGTDLLPPSADNALPAPTAPAATTETPAPSGN